MSLLEIRNLKKYFPVGEGLFSRNKGSGELLRFLQLAAR